MTRAAVVFSCFVVVAGCSDEPPRARLDVAAARAFYAAQPRFLRPVPLSPVPAGLADVRAETCGVCHVAIYEEWRVWTHARAWLDDAQFQEELKKTRAHPGRDAGWICVNCHTPYEAQLPRLVAALVDGDKGRPLYVENPSFDAAMQSEAITCATCHVRDGFVVGPFGASGAPHAVKKDEALLGAGVCMDCHQAEEAFPEVELACVFDTGARFLAGPHPAEGYTCQSCHMPEVVRPLTAQGTPVRRTRRHFFGGSLIPKAPEFEAEVDAMRAHYKEGASLALLDPPAAVAAGADVALSFSITNAEAGHTLPTGDVERYLEIEMRVEDERGEILARRAERIGTTYEWEPSPRKLADTRLDPRETRTFRVDFTAPARGPIRVVLTGEKRRINDANMAYHELEGRYIAGRMFARVEHVIDVK